MQTLLEPTDLPVSHDDDAVAIAGLHRLLNVQRVAQRANPYPSLDVRRSLLQALAGTTVAHREEIGAAMAADYAAHPPLLTDFIEVLGTAGRAAYAAGQLVAWTAAEERYADPAMYGSARATMRQQPKGVIGLIVPWNFPFDLSLGPLVEMLAAGNRVIIKPSEFTPACAKLLAAMVAKTFDEDRVAVVTGGLALAKEFPTLRWDHLMYTGSPGIGREVARAAAENLVPLTLELGGKCPAIMTPGSVDAAAVRNVVATKLVKSGQVCISVDYALVPRGELEDFVTSAQRYVDEEMPGYASSDDATGIITERHRERLEAMVDQARQAGARVVTLGGEGDTEHRRLPLSLVIDPRQDLRIMQEEIFGPILPVVPYDDLDEALDAVNAGERPLGVYVYGDDSQVIDHVLERTTSGGACVNASALQGTLASLGFGGVGTSGYGRHHGIEGFREFSNPRGVVVRGSGDLLDALLPPYGAMAQAVADAAFGGSAPETAAPGAV